MTNSSHEEQHAVLTSETAGTDHEESLAQIASDSSCEKPLVIVAHASVGSGHRSAANAIAQALKLQQEELCSKKVDTVTGDIEADNLLREAEIEVIDILDFGRVVFDGNKTASLFTGATRPIYDLTWRYTLTGRILWSGGTIWSRIMYAPFTEYVRMRKPVAIICTHITAANAAVSARMLTGLRFPIIAVPTDYETEGLWPQLSCDIFCVANEFMAETLRPRKIPEERILITGIPTREDFRRELDRDKIRETYELPQDKNIVLALAGAYLPRPYVHFRAALDKTLPYLHLFDSTLHFVFVAGQDKEYARHLQTQCRVKLRLAGFWTSQEGTPKQSRTRDMERNFTLGCLPIGAQIKGF